MIRTVADLLEAIKIQELKKIQEFGNLSHGPMIGSMYEGLTKFLAEKVLFDDLGLRVLSGKIKSQSGKLSDQIDCMIVEGAGTQIPHTDNWIYNVDQVIAVIEVKKNLYSSDIQSARDNLLSVANLKPRPEMKVTSGIRTAFKNISWLDMPESNDLIELPFSAGLLMMSLLHDSSLPLRIVFGYDGFSSELSLRNSFVEQISANFEELGFGKHPSVVPHGLPDLIVCGNFSLVKLNGMPYSCHIVSGSVNVPEIGSDNWYPIYGSLSNQSLLVFIELLWYRLRQRFNIAPEVFGFDFSTEAISVLLFAKGYKNEQMGGWAYSVNPVTQLELTQDRSQIIWQPREISVEQSGFLATLGKVESIDLSNIPDNITNDKEEFLKRGYELLKSGLIYVDSTNHLRLLTEKLMIGVLPDGRIVAADDGDGRFTVWITEYAKNRRDE